MDSSSRRPPNHLGRPGRVPRPKQQQRPNREVPPGRTVIEGDTSGFLRTSRSYDHFLCMVRFVFIPKWQFPQDMEDQLMTVSQDLEGRKRARNHGGEESYVTHRRSRIDRERLTPLSLSFDFRVINLAICFSPIRTLPFALLEGGRNCAALNLSAVRVTSSFDPIHFLSSWPVFQ